MSTKSIGWLSTPSTCGVASRTEFVFGKLSPRSSTLQHRQTTNDKFDCTTDSNIYQVSIHDTIPSHKRASKFCELGECWGRKRVGLKMFELVRNAGQLSTVNWWEDHEHSLEDSITAYHFDINSRQSATFLYPSSITTLESTFGRNHPTISWSTANYFLTPVNRNHGYLSRFKTQALCLRC